MNRVVLVAVFLTMNLFVWPADSVAQRRASPAFTQSGQPGKVQVQSLQFVYDGRKDSKAAAVSNSEVQAIRRFALPKARRHWRNDGVCEEQFEPIGAAQGSFTSTRVQRAVLYQFCVTGHNFANNGLVIFEQGTIVTHFAFSGGEYHDIGALRDVTGDGLSELILANSAMNQGYANSVIKILSVSSHGVDKFGIVQTYEDDCGAKERGCRALAYRILASAGPEPKFYREVFRLKARAWIKISNVRSFAPRPDEIDYTKLN